jgi:hypothetical protein
LGAVAQDLDTTEPIDLAAVAVEEVLEMYAGVGTSVPFTAVVRCSRDQRLPVVALGEYGKTVVV